MAESQLAEIAHQDRHSVSLCDDYVAEVVQCAHHADSADNIALFAARNTAAAGIGTVVVDRGDHVVQADAITLKLQWVELQLILFGKTAEIGDTYHAGHLLKGGHDGPSLELRKFHQVFGVRLQRISVDFARRAG